MAAERSLLRYVLVAVCLAAGGLFIVPAYAADVVVVNATESGPDDFGDLRLAGEVQNNTSTPVGFVDVTVDLYDNDDDIFYSDSVFAYAERLDPTEKAPFVFVYPEFEDYDHYELTVRWDDVEEQSNRDFTVEVTDESTDDFDIETFSGTVTNNNETEAGDVSVVFTFRESDGSVVDAATGFVDETTLAPGESSDFEVSRDEADLPDYDSYDVFADSPDEGDRQVLATPTVTGSPAPSPSASATPSPTSSSPPPIEQFRRNVTLRLRGHLTVKGTVRSVEPACIRRVKVAVQKFERTGWVTSERVVTTEAGAYRARVRDRAGVYRARLVGTQGCTRAQSNLKPHAHPDLG